MSAGTLGRRYAVIAGICLACRTGRADWPISEQGSGLAPKPGVRTGLRHGIRHPGCTFSLGDSDQALAQRVDLQTMPDLAPVGNLLKADELIMLQRVMKVDARIQFYVDDTPNAVALPKKPTEAFDGTILVGVNMISKVPTDYDYTALYGVIGHESSHLLQYARNPEWISGGKAPELHADFMGGYYIAVRTWRYHQLTLNRDAFGALLFALGDCDFSNPLHHGTPDERRDAMEAGYEVARSNPGVSVDEAYRAGLSWLSR